MFQGTHDIFFFGDIEDTLKDQLWDALKKLKTLTSNDDGCEKVMLQNEEVLAQLKAMNGHTIRTFSKDGKM